MAKEEAKTENAGVNSNMEDAAAAQITEPKMVPAGNIAMNNQPNKP